MKQVKGFCQLVASTYMLVFVSQGAIYNYTIVDPSRYNVVGADTVLRLNNPHLAPHCVYQGHDKKHGLDVYYCGWN